MKRKQILAWLLLAVMFSVLCTGCAKKETEVPPEEPPSTNEPSVPPAPAEPESTEEPDEIPPEEEDVQFDSDTTVYAPILDATCSILYNGLSETADERYVPFGVFEMAMWATERGELLESVGYTITDLSGDGVPELLIGMLPDETAEVETKCVLFGGYTCKDGELVTFLEGWARNSYQWMGDRRFYLSGSGGASRAMFGTYQLTSDGTALTCEDFYFTSEKDADFQVIGRYHNTTGDWDKDTSEELNISEDAFWRIMNSYEDDCRQLELTPFSVYRHTDGTNDASTQQSAACKVRVDYLEDVADKLTDYRDAALEDDTLAGGDYETKVVFRADEEVSDFTLLALELRDVDEDGHAVFAVTPGFSLPKLEPGAPLAVPMSFPGDIPNNGFSYVDKQGVTRQFSLSMSGRDGSLVILPIDG